MLNPCLNRSNSFPTACWNLVTQDGWALHLKTCCFWYLEAGIFYGFVMRN